MGDLRGGFGTSADMQKWGFPAIDAPVSTFGGMDIASLGGISPVSSYAPQAGPSGIGSGLGLNMGTAQLGLGALSTIAGLWSAAKQMKLAKQQFKYTRDVTDTNLANQIKTYNTTLTDRANNRQIVEGKTPEQTQSYITSNALSRYGNGK
jgi:hypothetical protein